MLLRGILHGHCKCCLAKLCDIPDCFPRKRLVFHLPGLPMYKVNNDGFESNSYTVRIVLNCPPAMN